MRSFNCAIVNLLLFFTTSVSTSPTPVILNELINDTASPTDKSLVPRGTPTGPGPMCSALTTYSDFVANVTIFSPSGNIIGHNQSIDLPGKGWFNLDSELPYTLAMTKTKNGLLLQYSNDQPWTVLPQTPTTNAFDCRQFKFNLISNFWQFEEGKNGNKQGTLNWTMLALDGTKLGQSPQTDLMMGLYGPAASLSSLLDEVVNVYWGSDNSMSFEYGEQKISYSNATGLQTTTLIGSAPMGAFSWTSSGTL